MAKTHDDDLRYRQQLAGALAFLGVKLGSIDAKLDHVIKLLERELNRPMDSTPCEPNAAEKTRHQTSV